MANSFPEWESERGNTPGLLPAVQKQRLAMRDVQSWVGSPGVSENRQTS